MNLAFLSAVSRHATPAKIKALETILPKYEINTARRVACYLAQVMHETEGFRYIREIWGPTAQQLRYEGTDLAVRLGNTTPGDGKVFRGWGDMQTTGRGNTLKVSTHLFGDSRLVDNPALLNDPAVATESGAYYWKTHDLNRWADLTDGALDPDFKTITKRINGGFTGHDDNDRSDLDSRVDWLFKLLPLCENAFKAK